MGLLFVRPMDRTDLPEAVERMSSKNVLEDEYIRRCLLIPLHISTLDVKHLSGTVHEQVSRGRAPIYLKLKE